MIREIAALAEKHDLIVLSDEIYAKLLYEGHEHLSIATLPGMKERTITLNGFSKSYAMTGWRVGYLAAPRAFVRAITEVRHTLSINTSTPSQFAALAALEGPQEPVEEMVAEYARRRAFMMAPFDRMGLTYGPPGGAFCLYVNVTSTGLGANDFCLRLLQEARVLVFPGALFGDDADAYMRIGYLQPMARIEEAAERIERFVLGLRGAA